MNNKLFVCTYVSEENNQVYCGYVWANHYVIYDEYDCIEFFDVHDNTICFIPDCNFVKEVYKG